LQAISRILPGSLGYKGLRFAKIFRDSALPVAQAYRDKVSIWRASELKELLTPDMVQVSHYLDNQFLPTRLTDIMMRPGRDLVSRLTEMDIQSYMLDDILVKVDRMSMAHSLEVRSPLLDHNVAELAAKMPTRMKIRGGRGKHVLREVLRDKLPKQSIRKGKQGFAVPLRDWFRGSLSNMVNDYLGPGGYLPAEIFSQDKVQQVLREHRSGSADHARKIWLLLVFAAWHRLYQRNDSKTNGMFSKESVSCES
jgi:asparagine synthase (glutamine-hydrolysing)